MQLGDKGKLLEQGTQVEVEVEMVQPPKLAAARQVRGRTAGILDAFCNVTALTAVLCNRCRGASSPLGLQSRFGDELGRI